MCVGVCIYLFIYLHIIEVVNLNEDKDCQGRGKQTLSRLTSNLVNPIGKWEGIGGKWEGISSKWAGKDA